MSTPAAKIIRWFHSRDGLFFDRLADGSVRILKTDGKRPDEGGEVSFKAILDDGTWCSIVLTMTAFNERPNDWYKMMDFHLGRKDLIAPPEIRQQ